MRTKNILKQMSRLLGTGTLILIAAFFLVRSVYAQEEHPLSFKDFHQINESGFGDRQNSWSWTMQWWNGKVYVGTNRCWNCYTRATQQRIPFWGKFVSYPPNNPNVECAPTPEELPLSAEIWSYDPDFDLWERVFQSPTNVEIPEHPGQFTARDIAFRTSVLFKEPDKTEALYIFGVTSHTLWPTTLPPQILRSTDGSTFEPVPQDPGTVLGDLNLDVDRACYRSAIVHNEKLYVNVCGLHGSGRALEAENPSGGNDNFRYITPPEIRVYCLASFNGLLYIGLENASGYSVVKTDTTGEPPYTLTPVVTNGGFLPKKPSKTPLYMHVFKDRLYVGMDRPAELIRINPDNTWDLVVGTPRETPEGWKYPLSGMDAGFDYSLNFHIWRMQTHDDYLYVSTADATQHFFGGIPILKKLFRPQMGFDLYATPDGWSFYKITITGFDNIFNNGLRSWASTPYGLFFGTANEWYGTEVWFGSRDCDDFELERPEFLEAETQGGAVVLSWDPPAGTTRFHVFRSTSIDLSENMVEYFDEKAGSFVDQFSDSSTTKIATVGKPFFVDSMVEEKTHYTYYVKAEDVEGNISEPSNIVVSPSLAPMVTFTNISETIKNLDFKDKFVSPKAKKQVLRTLRRAHTYVGQGKLERAEKLLRKLHRKVKKRARMIAPLSAEDLEILLGKLIKRVCLVKAGILSPSDLY